MKSIFKYPLSLDDNPVVSMPKGARTLSVKMQDDNIMVWALVDVDAPYVDHLFAIRGTGHPVMPEVEQGDFIGTVFDVVHGHPLVWHIFDLGDID